MLTREDFEALSTLLDERLEKAIDERVPPIVERIATRIVDEQANILVEAMADGFEKVDRRFDLVDIRFDRLGEKVDRIELEVIDLKSEGLRSVKTLASHDGRISALEAFWRTYKKGKAARSI